MLSYFPRLGTYNSVGVTVRARVLTHTSTTTYINININMKRPQHITITSIKYLISYPINMKVSNRVFTTSNSNKCVRGLCLSRAP